MSQFERLCVIVEQQLMAAQRAANAGDEANAAVCMRRARDNFASAARLANVDR